MYVYVYISKNALFTYKMLFFKKAMVERIY